MYVVVGLGNPGARYRNTYHNIGFMTADALAKKCKLRFAGKECAALTAKGKIGGVPFVLAKPQTFMNLSGESVKQLVRKYCDGTDELIVVYETRTCPWAECVSAKRGARARTTGCGA